MMSEKRQLAGILWLGMIVRIKRVVTLEVVVARRWYQSSTIEDNCSLTWDTSRLLALARSWLVPSGVTRILVEVIPQTTVHAQGIGCMHIVDNIYTYTRKDMCV